MPKTFQERLVAAKEQADFRDADLARWFARTQSTIVGWLAGNRPSGTQRELSQIEVRISRLETMISRKKLPVQDYKLASDRLRMIASLR